MEFHSGFVVLVGAPNVGKSTLLNRLLGDKVSITSQKPQTTRNRIIGIVHRPDAQIIFIDTPGVHKTSKMLNTRMVKVALAALADVDLIALVADVDAPDPPSEAVLIKHLQRQKQPVILVLNKIDQIGKQRLLELIEKWSHRHGFEAVVPVSALAGTQVPELLEAMAQALPPGPAYYPKDHITDLPERFIAAEMIREKVIRLTGEEIPYATAVTVESFKEDLDRPLVRIHATIHVERESQKGILIGKNGAKLRQIGQAARLELERLVGMQVFLKLFVRVEKNWSKNTKALRKFGY